MRKNKRFVSTMMALFIIGNIFPVITYATEESDTTADKIITDVENVFPKAVEIWYKDIIDSEIRSEAWNEADNYIDSLDTTDYTPTELQKIYVEYFKMINIELHKKAYFERSREIIESLGIDKTKAMISNLAPVIICEVTEEQYLNAESNELIESISEYDPIENPQDLTLYEAVSIMPGDANCDYRVSISDAVAILQYIANAQKYPLSDQGKINADIDGRAGITGGDAIAIQKIDAGILN